MKSDESLCPTFQTKDLKTIGIAYEKLTVGILCLLMRKITLFDESDLTIQADTECVDRFNRKYGFTKLTCDCKCRCTPVAPNEQPADLQHCPQSKCKCTCTLYECRCKKDCFKSFEGTINVVFTEQMALNMDSHSRYWLRNLALQATVCVKLFQALKIFKAIKLFSEKVWNGINSILQSC